MGLARKLERRLEQLVDGLSAAIFRGGMHPVELAGRLVRHADLLVEETPTGPAIPNNFTVRVNPKDLVADIDPRALDHEMTMTLAATAAERGWRIGGPVRVHVASDEAVGIGSIACQAAPQPGAIAPWAQLIDVTDGVPHPVSDNRILIGRSPDADIVLPNAEVSREHALLFRRDGAVWIVDLGSVNGTTVNGAAVDGDPFLLHAGDHVTLGSATLALRLL